MDRGLDDWAVLDLDFRGAPPAEFDLGVPRRVVPQHSRVVTSARPGRVRRRLDAHDRHAARVQADLEAKPVLWFERFPVSILLVLMYGVMAVRPAVEHHTVAEPLILELCAGSAILAFGIELAFAWSPAGRKPRGRQFTISVRGSAVVLGVGLVAQALIVWTSGNFASTAAGVARSGIATAVSPVQSWLTFGVVLFLWHWRNGQVTRRLGLSVLAAGFLLQLVLLYRSAEAAPLAVFGITVLFSAIIIRAVRVRWAVAAVVVGVIVWPTLYGYRNDVRFHSGQPSAGLVAPSASDRLREDLNMSQLSRFPSLPADFGQPTVGTEVRYGLLPRIIDSHRPTLRTATNLSVALGGSNTSAATLTPVGEAYASDLWLGVGFYLIPLVIVMQIALRRRSPWGLLVAGLLVTNAIWIESTYPDDIAAILQAAVSLIGVWVVMRLVPGGRLRSWRRID